jgi:hypothetical protein
MWNTICVEGYCFGEENKGKYPCGRNTPTHLCLMNNLCPHFSWCKTKERDVSIWVPLYLLIGDRIRIWVTEIWYKLHWWFWGQLWFNRRKMREWLSELEVATVETCPELKEWEDEQTKANNDFKIWFAKLTEEDKIIYD